VAGTIAPGTLPAQGHYLLWEQPEECAVRSGVSAGSAQPFRTESGGVLASPAERPEGVYLSSDGERVAERHYDLRPQSRLIGPCVPLSPHEAEWLSLVRYQALSSVELSRQPPPLGGTAINGLQDAVEAFLRLCVEHLHVIVSPKSEFLQVFDAVDKHPSVNGALGGHRAGLLALNQARVGFKHHGNVPSPATMERARVNAQAFLDQACQLVLGQRLDEVSLTAFIRDNEARRLAEAASTAWANGNADEAMASLRLAFDRLVRDYEQRKVWHQGRSLFTTKPSSVPRDQELKKLGIDKLSKLVEWLKALDQRTTLLAFGIDLRRYAYFEAHTPIVGHTLSGMRRPAPREGVVITEDVFRRCYRFLIDTALMLGAEDYDFDAWASRQRQREASQDGASEASA
jgi:hypothetical protein